MVFFCLRRHTEEFFSSAHTPKPVHGSLNMIRFTMRVSIMR